MAADYSSKAFFDTSGKGVLITLNAGVCRHILFYVLDDRYGVKEFEILHIVRKDPYEFGW